MWIHHRRMVEMIGLGLVLVAPGAAADDSDQDHRLGLRGGVNLLIFRGRDPDADAPKEELLFGPTLSYERTILPARLHLGVAGPVMIADNRFDFPVSLFGKVIHRAEEWDFYFAPGLTVNTRFFQNNRRNEEGRGDELSIGGKLGLGASLRMTRSWNLDIDGGYTFIPLNSTVSHELGLAAGFSFGF
jgi:hypothetical protein